jgi:hypothetical protein
VWTFPAPSRFPRFTVTQLPTAIATYISRSNSTSVRERHVAFVRHRSPYRFFLAGPTVTDVINQGDLCEVGRRCRRGRLSATRLPGPPPPTGRCSSPIRPGIWVRRPSDGWTRLRHSSISSSSRRRASPWRATEGLCDAADCPGLRPRPGAGHVCLGRARPHDLGCGPASASELLGFSRPIG